MNDLMNSNTAFYLIIIFLFFIIVFLLALIAFFLYLFTKNQKNLNLGPVFNESDKKNIAPDGRSYCFFHKELHSEGLCAICEKALCEPCINQHDKIIFCPEHFKIFLAYKWKDLETIRTTPDTPLEGINLYNFKSNKWKNENIPMYLVTHYKINVELDQIESYVTLFVREDDWKSLHQEFYH